MYHLGQQYFQQVFVKFTLQQSTKEKDTTCQQNIFSWKIKNDSETSESAKQI